MRSRRVTRQAAGVMLSVYLGPGVPQVYPAYIGRGQVSAASMVGRRERRGGGEDGERRKPRMRMKLSISSGRGWRALFLVAGGGHDAGGRRPSGTGS